MTWGTQDRAADHCKTHKGADVDDNPILADDIDPILADDDDDILTYEK